MGTRPETQFASNDGLSIAYQVVGDGPWDLVAIPGFQSHVELNWDYVFSSALLVDVSSYARTVIFDKRGSGLSDRSLGTGSIEDRMSDITAVMDAAGVERASLVGVSNGGPLAAVFAACHPERVDTLVLYLTGVPRGPDPSFEETLDLVQRYWHTGLVMNELVAHPDDRGTAIEQLARFERYTCTPSVCVEILRRGAEADIEPFLPLIQAPTLVVNHRDDPIVFLSHGEQLAAGIPGAEHAVIDADFHLSWQPSDYEPALRRIREFVTGRRAEPVSATRLLATVLFTDIVRSTDRAADLGDTSWVRVLDRHDEICHDEVDRRRGVLVKHTGDGTLAYFDSPGRAVDCALAINDRVGALGLRTRSGVHTGEVERRGDDLGGIAVHLASRVMDQAGPGEVVASRTVMDLTIGGGLTYEDRGLHTLKGVPGTWRLFAVS